MMLDNKNEQKWPLTEKEVLKKEQTVKGHFFCSAASGRIFCAWRWTRKNGQPAAAPTYSSYHMDKKESTIN